MGLAMAVVVGTSRPRRLLGEVAHDQERDGGYGDDWNRVQGVTVTVQLRAGANSIAFTAADGYAPDLDAVAVTGGRRTG